MTNTEFNAIQAYTQKLKPSVQKQYLQLLLNEVAALNKKLNPKK